MAEEMVVKEELTSDLILAGDLLTQALRHDNEFGLVCSLWLYTAASNRWRFDLSSPIVDSYGPLQAYRIIQQKLEASSLGYDAIPLDYVSVLSPTHIVVASLRTLGHFEIMDLPPSPRPRVRVPKRIKFSRVGDVIIDDAFVYYIE